MEVVAARESDWNGELGLGGPPVTVGMPIYNGAEWVEVALAALTAQTYRNFTVIVSDNGSTDGTWELLESWAARDSRFGLHRQQNNIGAMPNFRYVLDQAKTELFIWHAYDDWWAPNYLEVLVAVISSAPECSVACGDTMRCLPDGSPKKAVRFPTLPKGRLRRVTYLLCHPEATWIYGLFRADALSRAHAIAEEFAHVWATDRVALLSFIVNDRIQGSSDTTFFQRTSERSSNRYRPVKFWDQASFLGRLARYHVRIFAASRLTLFEKLFTAPWLIVHLARTAHLRNVKRFVKWPVQRLVARLSGRAWSDPRER